MTEQTILRVDASMRKSGSASRTLTDQLIDELQKSFENTSVITRDLAEGVPFVDAAWIEANFKETQLRHIRPGQPVEIRSDLYGDDVVLRGVVDSIGTGTGAVFSLLPPQNATGNWIKIVQRVPVRIELEAGFDQEHPLPFGASLQVKVDTHDRTGPALAIRDAREPIANAELYEYQDQGVDELIDEIISAHGVADSGS